MELLKSSSILFILLNPFLMSVYLMTLIRELSFKDFYRVMLRAHVISGMAFISFALAGENVFESVFKVRFASFLIFGGILFLIIGIKAVFSGRIVLIETRGNPEHIAGSIAMPFMIAPGTLSASILVGSSLPAWSASLAIAIAMIASILSLLLFKLVHDPLQKTNERLLNRYVEIAGRVVALFTGTYAIDMIARGIVLLSK